MFPIINRNGIFFLGHLIMQFIGCHFLYASDYMGNKTHILVETQLQGEGLEHNHCPRGWNFTCPIIYLDVRTAG